MPQEMFLFTVNVPAIQIEDHCGGVGRGREPWCEERVGLSEDWLFAIYTKQLNVDIKL